MKLLLIDPNVSLTSPSMKGIVRSLPALKAQGWEIEAWCWHCDDGLPLEHVEKLPGIGRMHTLGGYAFALWARLLAWWRFTLKCQPRPDVIYSVAWYVPRCDVAHVHFSPWDWEQRQRMLGVKSLRDAFECVTNFLGMVLANRFLRKTTARVVLTVSEAVAVDVRKVNPRLNVSVLPNSYDPVRFHAGVKAEWREVMRAKLGFVPEDRVFIFVSAGHYRRKGFFLAVESLARLHQSHRAAKMLVVGGTESRLHALKGQLDAQHSGWRDFITFTGMVPDVERYFAAADAFLFPSFSEAFALVEVEAAACGIPLFLTRHHGSEMILDDGVNGRYMDFNAGHIAEVLAEFVRGEWKTQPGIHLKHALDSEAYAVRIGTELARAASASSRLPSPDHNRNAHEPGPAL